MTQGDFSLSFATLADVPLAFRMEVGQFGCEDSGFVQHLDSGVKFS